MIGPLAYIGGKRRMAKRLIALFPPHTTYVEPFAGGAQVFFRKPPSPVEVLNDVDGELVNVLRVMQLHPEELERYLKHMVASRRIFELYERQEPQDLTDVQRAARYVFLLKNSFGGRPTGRNYHYCVTKPPNYNPSTLPGLLAAAAKRLERVQLEQWPYQKVLERYDRATTFYFLDPPYVGLKWYRFNFTDDDFRELADRLGRIQGKFLLTINDHPRARDVFGRFNILDIGVTYTATRKVTKVNELVVSNYKISDNSDGS